MPDARPLVCLVAGAPLPEVTASRGFYPQIIRRAAGEEAAAAWLDVDLRDGSPLPDPARVGAVVITGSSSSVTERAPWMLRAEGYLREIVAAHVPTFGICFGHQMLGQALGGEVIKNPRGREIGTVDLEILADDPIFEGPARAGARSLANATHVDTVGTLPRGARVLARTALEPNAAVRFDETTWGVQFHPEMDAAVARTYLEVRRKLLEAEHIDADALLAKTDDAEVGRATLVRFLELARR